MRADTTIAKSVGRRRANIASWARNKSVERVVLLPGLCRDYCAYFILYRQILPNGCGGREFVGGFWHCFLAADGSVRAYFGIWRRRRRTIVGGGGQLVAGRRQFGVSPEDHSCEGRNLTVSCATICRIRPQFPVSQADHSCVGRNLTVSCATICRIRPQFPVSQADHSCVGRNLFKHGRHRRLSYAAVGGTRL